MTTAAELTAALEALPLGEPWAAAFAAASAAVASERATAEAALFPAAIEPVSADAIAAYTWHTSRLVAIGYGEQLAQLHARSLATHDELARCLRSPEALDDVMAAASRLAVPADYRETHAAAEGRAARAAVAAYQMAIARQIAEVKGHELAKAARALLATEDLATRLAAAKARHEEHARADLERQEQERRAAARQVADRTVERVRAAAAAAEDLRQRAALAEREYRKLRSEAFVARLHASGLSDLRVGSGDSRQLFSVADLIRTASANEYSIQRLDHLEAALDAHEAAE